MIAEELYNQLAALGLPVNDWDGERNGVVDLKNGLDVQISGRRLILSRLVENPLRVHQIGQFRNVTELAQAIQQYLAS